MRSEYKILIASAILITALIVPCVNMTTSWFSDVEEANVDVSILKIEVKDSSNNTVPGTNWKWELNNNGTYTVTASTNTFLIVNAGSITVDSSTIEAGYKVPITQSGTIITAHGNVTLSLLPLMIE